jgi:acyl-coenzyme A thioesterase PaaI-like protein
MVHGGIIAAIIDASMAQCLMGHGIAGVTIELTVKYRKPVLIHKKTDITTRIESVNCGVLHSLKCDIVQNHNLVVQGTGRFYIKK